MAMALVDALLREKPLVAAARRVANSKLRNADRLVLAVIQVLALFALLTAATAGLIVFGKLTLFGKQMFAGGFSVCSAHPGSRTCAGLLEWMAVDVFGGAFLAVLLAGLLRFGYDWWFKGK